MESHISDKVFDTLMKKETSDEEFVRMHSCFTVLASISFLFSKTRKKNTLKGRHIIHAAAREWLYNIPPTDASTPLSVFIMKDPTLLLDEGAAQNRDCAWETLRSCMLDIYNHCSSDYYCKVWQKEQYPLMWQGLPTETIRIALQEVHPERNLLLTRTKTMPSSHPDPFLLFSRCTRARLKKSR